MPTRPTLPFEAGDCRLLKGLPGFHASLCSQKIIDNYKKRRESCGGVSWKTRIAHVTDSSEHQRLSRLDGYLIDEDSSSTSSDGFNHVIFIPNGNTTGADDNVGLGCSFMQQLQQSLRPVRSTSEIDNIDPGLIEEGF